MEAPKYNPPPSPEADPELKALSDKAKADDLRALSDTARMDTASLMARFGTKLAMSGSLTSPLIGGV